MVEPTAVENGPDAPVVDTSQEKVWEPEGFPPEIELPLAPWQILSASVEVAPKPILLSLLTETDNDLGELAPQALSAVTVIDPLPAAPAAVTVTDVVP